MADSLAVLYYSACRVSTQFAEAVRAALLRSTAGRFQIICVTHKPVKFGDERIVVGDVEPSIWQVYQNVLTAARATSADTICCCEDDSVYAPSHFTYRPAFDTFAYDRSRWVITRRLSDDGKCRQAFYYWRERTQMAMCVASRALLIETLEEKFAKYPVPPISTDVAKKSGWGEPGRYEKNLGLTLRKREYFDSPEPSVTFNHSVSLMGRRKVNPDDIIRQDLPPWGDANDLWKRVHG